MRSPQRKRHRPEGERRQPLAPSASGVRSNYQEGGTSSSGSALLPPPAPPPLAKRSSEQETEMTDATVEQQGESKRCREHPEAPQAADSSRSSSSESSTDTAIGRIGVRAPVLQPHAPVPLPPLVPEVRQVRRAPIRRTDFGQFGYTDTCPGCANARAGRKQAVDHSEQCRSRMKAILVTTTEGHERLERARDRFPQAGKEREDEEPSAQETSP